MNVDVPCPQCGTVFTVRRELLGKRTKCIRCGTAFTLTEPLPAPPPPPPTANYFPEIPPPPPEITPLPQITPQPTPRAASRPAQPQEPQESVELVAGQPRFTALRMMARGFEILAILVLAFAAILLGMLVIAVIRNPDAILAILLGTGPAFFWATLIAMSLLAFAQTIRLALQIEQNTRQTHQACRQLADHLCAIETEP